MTQKIGATIKVINSMPETFQAIREACAEVFGPNAEAEINRASGATGGLKSSEAMLFALGFAHGARSGEATPSKTVANSSAVQPQPLSGGAQSRVEDYRQRCAANNERPLPALVDVYAGLDAENAVAKIGASRPMTTATAQPKKKFGDIVHSIKAAQNCSLGEAVQIAVKTHPIEHREYVTNGGGPIERSGIQNQSFEQVVAAIRSEGLSEPAAVREAISIYKV